MGLTGWRGRRASGKDRTRRSLPSTVVAATVGLAAALALGVVSAPTAAPACTRTWDGGAGTTAWSTAANWSPDGIPAATDHVCIPAGSTVVHANANSSVLSLQSAGQLTLSSGTLALTDAGNESTVSDLTQAGGTLAGAGTLRVEGLLRWTGGFQVDGGRTVVAAGGSALVDPGGSDSVFMEDGRQFDNEGTVDWVSGHIRLGRAAVATRFNNSGRFQLADNHSFFIWTGTGLDPELRNLAGGLMVKAAGAGATTVAVPYDNDGVLEVGAGTVNFSVGDLGGSSGHFVTSGAGSLLRFTAGSSHTFAAGALLSGRLEFAAARLTVPAGVTITVPAGSELTQGPSSTLAGAGTLRVEGLLRWTGGFQVDGGRTVVAAGGSALVDPGGSDSVFMEDGRQFDNEGTVDWVSGHIRLGRAAVATRFNNSGRFQLADNHSFFIWTGTGLDPELRNLAGGLMVKAAGAGATTVAVPYDNDGVLEVGAGTVNFSVGDLGGSSGHFVTSGAGSLLRFTAGSSHTFAAGALLSGRLEFAAARLTVPAGVTITVPAGSELTQGPSSTLAGAGTLRVEGLLRWTGGFQVDGGRTVVAAGGSALVDPGGSDSVFMEDGRQFDNEGTVDWVSGHIRLGRAAVATRFNNSGRFQLADNHSFFIWTGTGLDPELRNLAGGLMVKAAGAGTTAVSFPFDNDGTLQVDTGTVALSGEFANFLAASRTLSGGSYILKGTFRFPGADIVTNAATIVLDGAGSQLVDALGANGLRRLADNAAGGDLTLTNGRSAATTVPFANHGRLALGSDSSFTSTGSYEQAAGSTLLQASTSALTATGAVVSVTGGSLAGIGTVGPAVTASGGEVAPGLSAGVLRTSGSYTQSASAALRVEIGGRTAGTDFDQLAVTGAAALNGTLRIETTNGFSPADGDRFRILTAGSRTGEFLSLVGADIGGGLGYTADYDSTGVWLVISNQSVSIGDASVTEGDTGTTNATFELTLPGPRTQQVTVDYATADGTAVAPADYAPANGTVTFAPGQTSKTITVAVKGDTLDENAETFFVNLSNAANATIAKGQGVATIADNDPQPALSIADVEVPEGDTGTTATVFTVTLAPASGRKVSVSFATADGTATSPADFAPATGSITFEPGETTKQVTVQVKGDDDAEGVEDFFVDLSAPDGAALGDGRGRIRILDDDLSSLSIADTAVTEGNRASDGAKATFTVSLSPAAAAAVSVRYATVDGTATVGEDYEPAAGTVTFAPGQTSAQFEVQVIEDTTPEPDERFGVVLSDPSNAAIGDGDATGLIADDGDATGEPDFQLLISPQDQVLSPGESVTYEIAVLGLFGFDAPVTLEVLTLPAGVTAELSPSTVTPDGTSTLTVTASADAALGDYELVVRGTGGGKTHELRTSWSLNFGLTPICTGGIDGFVTEEADPKFGVRRWLPDRRCGDRPLLGPAPDERQRVLQPPGDPAGRVPPQRREDRLVEPGRIGDSDGDVRSHRTRQLRAARLAAGGRARHRRGRHAGRDGSGDRPPDDHADRGRRGLPAVLRVRRVGGGRDLPPRLREAELPQPADRQRAPARGRGRLLGPPKPRTVGGPLSSPIPIGDVDPHDEIQVTIPLVKKCTGSVSGRVIDKVTRQPVVGARMEVHWPIEDLPVTTDADGPVHLSRRAPGLQQHPDRPDRLGVRTGLPLELRQLPDGSLRRCTRSRDRARAAAAPDLRRRGRTRVRLGDEGPARRRGRLHPGCLLSAAGDRVHEDRRPGLLRAAGCAAALGGPPLGDRARRPDRRLLPRDHEDAGLGEPDDDARHPADQAKARPADRDDPRPAHPPADPERDSA